MKQPIDESAIDERDPDEKPIGLINIGNTCWFNSVIQTLYTLPYFRHLVLNFNFPEANSPLDSQVSRYLSISLWVIFGSI